MKSLHLVFLLSSFLVFACSKSEEEIFQEDTTEIIDYLTKNNLIDQAFITSTGIYYIIENPGNIDKLPNLNSSITCAYKGYFPSGGIFDESASATFILGQTIEGWRQGIRLIGEGGSIRLFIPSALCYGKEGSGTIGSNEILFFDVDLLKIN